METETTYSLPEKLICLRKKNGLTQLDLAEKLNVSRQAISRWEVGTAVPNTDNLRILAELYNVSVDYLLSSNTVSTPLNLEKSRHTTNDAAKLYNIAIWVLAFLAVTATIIAIVLILSQFHRAEGTPAIPMEEASVDINNIPAVNADEYSSGTFDFE